jgi:predicted RNase H-like HicB family nuclease
MVDWIHRRTAGRKHARATLEEARENLKAAAQLIIQVNRELARRETRGKRVTREEMLVKA